MELTLRRAATAVALSTLALSALGCGSQPNDVCERSVLHIGVSTANDFVRPEALRLIVDGVTHTYGPDEPNTIGDEDFWSEIEEDAVVQSFRWPVPDASLAFEALSLPEEATLTSGTINLSEIQWEPALDSAGDPSCVSVSGEAELEGDFTILLESS